MSIGELRHRVTFQRINPQINENGFETELREEFRTVWAAVTNLHGKEYFAAKAIQAENTVIFTIRYQDDLDQTMKILFKGKTYDITAIDNIKYKKRYMEIQAMEVEPDG